METAAIIKLVRRIAVLEYALIDACHARTEPADGTLSAYLSIRVGTAQVHLFDLGTVLRELGDSSLSYSDCMRQVLLETGTPDEQMSRLERETERALECDVPEAIRTLLRANCIEHRKLRKFRPVAPGGIALAA